jgi:hypothetical protein
MSQPLQVGNIPKPIYKNVDNWNANRVPAYTSKINEIASYQNPHSSGGGIPMTFGQGARVNPPVKISFGNAVY